MKSVRLAPCASRRCRRRRLLVRLVRHLRATTTAEATASVATTDTWANWAQGFFTKYCVECHGASNPDGLDFGQQSVVVANKDTIRCGVCVSQDSSWSCPASPPAEQFPISDSAGTNPKPTDDERNRVVAWIGAGCP